MNAVPRPTTEFVEENGVDVDSDDNPEELLEYYQPISSETGEDSDDNDDVADSNHLSNGHTDTVENGILSLDLTDEDQQMREVHAAFTEDERRREAPLTMENATRVMEAMRGVSFGGTAPDWANQVPEDQWIMRLKGLRQPPPHEAGTSS